MLIRRTSLLTDRRCAATSHGAARCLRHPAYRQPRLHRRRRLRFHSHWPVLLHLRAHRSQRWRAPPRLPGRRPLPSCGGCAWAWRELRLPVPGQAALRQQPRAWPLPSCGVCAWAWQALPRRLLRQALQLPRPGLRQALLRLPSACEREDGGASWAPLPRPVLPVQLPLPLRLQVQPRPVSRWSRQFRRLR